MQSSCWSRVLARAGARRAAVAAGCRPGSTGRPGSVGTAFAAADPRWPPCCSCSATAAGPATGRRRRPCARGTEVDLPWVPGLDLRFHLGVDGISYPLVVLTALLTLLCCAYTLWRVPDGRAAAGPWWRCCWCSRSASSAPSSPSTWCCSSSSSRSSCCRCTRSSPAGAAPDRRRAARKFVLYTLFGSVLLLVGVFAVVAAAGTADLVALTGGTGLSRSTQLRGVRAARAGVRGEEPALAAAHLAARRAHRGAHRRLVILAGVLLKMGTYGLIRVARRRGPGGRPLGRAGARRARRRRDPRRRRWSAWRQTELKRLIAYSSVGHMGFVLLGIATLTATGIQAALIGNIAHGVITGLLFFLAGAIKDRAHTGTLAELGGLRETAPRLAGLLGFAAIASLGLPGLAGFWGEAFAVVAAVERGGPLWTTLGVLAAVGGALTAAYFLRLLRRVTHGPAAARRSAGCPRPGRRGAGSPGRRWCCSRWPSAWCRPWCSASPRPGRRPGRRCSGERRMQASTTSRCCRRTWPPAPPCSVLLADLLRRPGAAGPTLAMAARRRAGHGASARAWSAPVASAGATFCVGADCSSSSTAGPPWSPCVVRRCSPSACSRCRCRCCGRAVAGRGVLLPARLLDDRRRGARRGRRPDHPDRRPGDADPAAVRAGRAAPAAAWPAPRRRSPSSWSAWWPPR